MRRDAFFAHLVHLFGADLDLEGVARFGDHRGMQRLIKIRPRHRDEVLDPARDRTPQVVNNAEHGVAVLHRIGDHPHGEEVVDLVDADALAQQLFVDAEEALDAALNSSRNAGFLQAVAQHAFDPRHEGFALLSARFHGRLHLFIADRVHVAEAEILQFAADLSHAEAVRDGRVDVERFAGDLLLAIWLKVFERPHVVQAIGQLDHDDADVVYHGQHHLAQVFGLRFFGGGKIDLADLGDAFDDMRHLLAKLLADFDGCDRGVFDRIVEQSGCD